MSLEILLWLKNNQQDFNNKKIVTLKMSKVSLKISLRLKINQSERSNNEPFLNGTFKIYFYLQSQPRKNPKQDIPK